jgi:hypothetical protein
VPGFACHLRRQGAGIREEDTSSTLAGYVCCNETFVLVLSTDTPHPGPSPRVRGEGEDLEQDWNPGFRWRSTLGYNYLAPNGAGTTLPCSDS